jgi:hypothetical protein
MLSDIPQPKDPQMQTIEKSPNIHSSRAITPLVTKMRQV